MSKLLACAMTMALAAGLALSLGSAAGAAPVGALKQFKVPTANSQPRAISNGSDGNRWFSEGTEFTSAPAKIARITSVGVITEFAPDVADGCNLCIITDIAQGPDDILYITSNDPTLMRFNVATQSFEPPVQMPNTSALGGDLAVSATDVWITDFNNDVVCRYQLADGQFTSFPVSDPADVAVDAAGNAWFTQPGDVNAPGTGNIGRIDAATGAVTRTPTSDESTAVAPHSITVAADGQVWFTARFTPQAVGRLDPATGGVTIFLRRAIPAPRHRRVSGRNRLVHSGHQGQHRQDRQRRRYHRGQGRQGQRTVRDHRRLQRRPLVHDVRRQQGRHAADAVEPFEPLALSPTKPRSRVVRGMDYPRSRVR